MCKTKASQDRAVASFFEKLRGESYRRPLALFERDFDGRADLTGFAAFVDGTLTLFAVMADDSVRCADHIGTPAMGPRGIAAYWGADYATAL